MTHLPAAPEISFVLNFEHAASSWMDVCFFSAGDLCHESFFFGTEVGRAVQNSAHFVREGFSRNVSDQGRCFTCLSALADITVQMQGYINL